MSIKKYSNGVWSEVGYKKYGTETDTITTLPKTIIGDGTNASAGIKGNLTQSGTPTPTNPIYPSETGDKTANLWSERNISIALHERLINVPIVLPVNTYTMSFIYTSTYTNYVPVIVIDSEGILHTYRFYPSQGRNYVTINDLTDPIASINLYSAGGYNVSYDYAGEYTDIMLTEGTSTVYEPYGQYKIPISSGGTTTTEYLGQVQSTRQIKKLVLTGEENWTFVSSSNIYIGGTGAKYSSTDQGIICSHFKPMYAGHTDGTCRFANYQRITFHYDSVSNVDEWKSYLAQQYAAGTPVTIWYVLATPTTGIVNEPIRKIGNYADSVSGANIPTTGTAEQFDVDTTLKPSEVQLTYHGWHEHSDTKFTE